MSIVTFAHVASATAGAVISYVVTAFLNSKTVAAVEAKAAADIAKVKADAAAIKAKV
jgi:hypothetical protein